MDRRSFLKLMGGIAALPIVGKYVKIAKKGADVVTPKVLKDQGMPEYFYSLIEGVKRFGKKIKSGRDEDVFEYTDPKTKQTVKVTDGRDETFVDFETDRGSRATMGVRKGQADETTKGMTPPDEYSELEEVYRMGGDDYYKDIDEFISGGTEGIEQLYKRLPKAGGGSVGMPPVFTTSDPKEAIKEVIKRTPNLSGETFQVPFYGNENISISGAIGGIDTPIEYGLGAMTDRANLSLEQYEGGDKGVRFGFNPSPNTNFQIGYTEGQEPQFGLQYRKEFNSGGITSGPPPKKGPNSQGLETLFQTR